MEAEQSGETIGRTVALMVQLMIDAPMQKVQLIMQTNKTHLGLNGGLTKNFISTAADLIRSQGFFSLWKGSMFYVLASTPINIAINLVKPAIMDGLLPNDYSRRNDFYRFIVLLGSGLVSDLFVLGLMTPITYVLTQISSDSMKLGSNFDFLISSSSAFTGLKDIILTDPTKLYTGIGIILLGKTLETAVSFILSTWIQKAVKYGDSEGLFLSNLFIKWVMQIFVYPFDTTWRRTMVSDKPYKGVVGSLLSGYREKGLLDGFGMYIVRNNFLDFYYVPYLLYLKFVSTT